MNKTEQFRYNVLEKLRLTFDQLNLAALVRDPTNAIPTHVLNILNNELGYNGEEVLGEYYFLPLTDENPKFHMFTGVLTLTDEMPEDRYEELGRAVNLLNFYLPVGAFVFSRPEKIMAFKYTSLIPSTFTEEEAINSIDGNVGMGFHLVNEFVDPLLKLMRKEITFKDFLDRLPEAYDM